MEMVFTDDDDDDDNYDDDPIIAQLPKNFGFV